MDTNVPEISIVGANIHTQFIGLSLGLCTPLRPNEVPKLKKFVYDKVSGRIMQEKEDKVSI